MTQKELNRIANDLWKKAEKAKNGRMAQHTPENIVYQYLYSGLENISQAKATIAMDYARTMWQKRINK